MRRVLVPITLALCVGSARADVGVRVVDAETPVLDGGVWSGTGGIDGAIVRVIGERAIFIVHTNAYGQFSIAGLAPGIYRVETDRGHLIDLAHGPVTLTEPYAVCDFRRAYGRSFDVLGAAIPPAPAALTAPPPSPERTTRRGHIDTTSTSQGVEIDSASLRSLP